MRFLFIGDIVGSAGRKCLARALPRLREVHEPELVIANGENAAGGLGINEKSAAEIHAAGVDIITLGNHTYRRREVYDYLAADKRIVRPANYPVSNPGRGRLITQVGDRRVGVLNLSGALDLTVARSPFPCAETEVAELKKLGADAVIVDFHAEVTSEKVAMGWHLDGEVAAVLGTHTHVPTADARVLPGGTAFISDVGMTGARDSILGVKTEQALGNFRDQMPVRFEPSDANPWINAVVVEVTAEGLASSIEQVLEPAEG